jgi:hypothetical protein
VAFIEVSRWDHAPAQPVLELRAWHRADRPTISLAWLRRPTGLATACLVHLAAGWLLLRYADATDGLAAGSAAKAMKLFSLSPDRPLTETVSTEQNLASEPANQSANPTTPQKIILPVSEWSVSKVRVASSTQAASPVSQSTSALPTQLVGNGSPVSGGDAYDPYAGASPRRPGDMAGTNFASPALVPSGSAFPAASALLDISQNRKLLIALEQELRRHFPKASGVFAISVRLDPDGRVTDIVDRRAAMDKAIFAWLRKRLRNTIIENPPAQRSQARMDFPEIRI